MNHPDPGAPDLDHPALGQNCSQLGLVHVPDHALDRRELPQLLEHRGADEIAGMKDQLGFLQPAYALQRQASRPAREMRVCDDRDQAQLTAPSRKAPSR